jgi:threonine dehydratase
MASRIPDDEPIEIISKNVERIVLVSDDEVRRAMKIYFTDTHNTVEGAGAASLAAALKEKEVLRNKRVGLIVTGGNVDHDKFAEVLLNGNH